MSEALKTLGQMTFEDSSSATFSPALEGGVMRSGLQGGPTSERCGQGVVLASPSVLLDSKTDSPTSVISGPSSSASSRSADLQSSLESRLRQRLSGSVECEVIWKKWITPWGQSLLKPRAQVRAITGIDIGLWPTMTSNSPAKGYNEAGNSAGQVSIRRILLGIWPTVVANDDNKSPEAHLRMKQRMGERDGSNSNRTAITSLQVMVKANVGLWSTLRASDGEKGGPRMSFGAGGSPLPSQAYKEASLSDAPMERGVGSLHPEFAGWEMQYPPEWLNCAPSVTPSSRKSQQSL